MALVASAVLAVACATSGSQSTDDASIASAPTLGDVVVVQRDGVTVVVLPGTAEAEATSSDSPEGSGVVLDLAGVGLDAPVGPIAVYDGVVEQVSATAYGEDARVEVTLAADAEHQLVRVPEGVELHVWPTADDAWAMDDGEAATDEAPLLDGEEVAEAGDAPDEFDLWSQENLDSEEIAADDTYAYDDDSSAYGSDEYPGETGEASLDLTIPAPPAARTLTGVDVESTEGGEVLHLGADGRIAAAEAFVLDAPPRLVIDLPGMTNEVHPATVSLGSDHASQLRIGAHDEKVRVVIDGSEGGAALADRQLHPVPNGLLVSLGVGNAVAQLLSSRVDAAEREWELAHVASGPPGGYEEAPVAAATDTDLWSEFAEEGGFKEMDPETGAEATAETTEPTDEWAAADDSTDAWAETDTETEVDDIWGGEQTTLATAEMVEPEPLVEEPYVPASPAPSSYDEPVASAIEEITPASDGSAMVTGINYESDASVDRIGVVADSSVKWSTYRPDAETFMLRITNAKLADGAGGRVAPSASSSLRGITTFQQPEVSPAEVRLVVKHPAGVEGRVSSNGSLLFVEFPNVGASGYDSAFDPTAPTMPTQAAANASQYAGVLGTDAMSNSLLPPPGSNPAAPASLEPPASIEILQEGGLIDGKDYQGRRISLDFKDVEIADVLRLIAEVSDLNVIAGDEVKGEVTIRLVDVPWDQALDVILLTKGLGFIRVGNVLRIAPADILAQEEEARLQERRAKEKLEDLVVKLIPVNYADVREMENLTKRLLSSRGTVNIDERTSTLIVKDIASVIDEASALVKAVDTETPQVMIEAKLVEANLDFSRELGTVWGASTNQFVDGFDDSSGPRRNLGGEDFLFVDQNSVSFFNNITSLPTGLLDLSALILNEKFNIDLQLQAAESTGNGKVISSPRVVTLDNTEAEVVQGVSIPFQTFENGDAQLQFIDAVLSLKVQPHITADKSIIMRIEVTRDAPDQTVQTPTGSPAIAKNQAKTETLVKDGQTLVLGGIYTIDKSYRSSRVPYLHSIPIIGAAFKSKEVSDVRKELLMFVTPRIVLQPESAS